MYWKYHASGDNDDDTVPGAVVDVVPASMLPSGISLLGRFNCSMVTPLPNFVIPTTGGSPLRTNSYRPDESQYVASAQVSCTYQAFCCQPNA